MPRTALCLACRTFLTDESNNLLNALRDHCLEQLDTHDMVEVAAVDVDSTFDAIMRRNAPWTRVTRR